MNNIINVLLVWGVICLSIILGYLIRMIQEGIWSEMNKKWEEMLE